MINSSIKRRFEAKSKDVEKQGMESEEKQRLSTKRRSEKKEHNWMPVFPVQFINNARGHA